MTMHIDIQTLANGQLRTRIQMPLQVMTLTEFEAAKKIAELTAALLGPQKMARPHCVAWPINANPHLS